jgi:myo-inositol-hexaphosphate 3-phosphohydrolase
MTFRGHADSTDGLDVTSVPLGPDFPDGLLVAMNSVGRNFRYYRWQDIAAGATPALTSSAPPASR